MVKRGIHVEEDLLKDYFEKVSQIADKNILLHPVHIKIGSILLRKPRQYNKNAQTNQTAQPSQKPEKDILSQLKKELEQIKK